jgi:hypothetical protein
MSGIMPRGSGGAHKATQTKKVFTRDEIKETRDADHPRLRDTNNCGGPVSVRMAYVRRHPMKQKGAVFVIRNGFAATHAERESKLYNDLNDLYRE